MSDNGLNFDPRGSVTTENDNCFDRNDNAYEAGFFQLI